MIFSPYKNARTHTHAPNNLPFNFFISNIMINVLLSVRFDVVVGGPRHFCFSLFFHFSFPFTLRFSTPCSFPSFFPFLATCLFSLRPFFVDCIFKCGSSFWRWAFFFVLPYLPCWTRSHLRSLSDIDFAIFMLITTFVVRCVLLICNIPFDCCSLLVRAHLFPTIHVPSFILSSCIPLESSDCVDFIPRSPSTFLLLPLLLLLLLITHNTGCLTEEGRTFLFFICSY